MAPRGDLSSLLDGLSTARGRWHSWQAHCAQLKQRFKPRYDAPGTGVYAPALLRQLSLKAGEHAFVSCDVGQHQMWVAQHWRMTSGRNHLTRSEERRVGKECRGRELGASGADKMGRWR